jgi:hypothetical protein
MTYPQEERQVAPEGRPSPWRRRPSRIRRDAAVRSEEPATTRTTAGAGTAVATAAVGLARIVRIAAGIVAAIIVAGILLIVLEANPSNDVVNAVHDAARALVGPFDGMFTLDSSKATVAVNWGIAALVYLVVGAVIARIILALGTAGARRPIAT